MSRPSKEQFMMQVAHLTAKRSTCSRLQTGAVIADARLFQFVMGYNGTYTGGPDRCIGTDQAGHCGCVHAEMNAVAKAVPELHNRAFLTDSPCILCAQLLVNLGVVELTYVREYRDTKGIEILVDAGVRVKIMEDYGQER